MGIDKPQRLKRIGRPRRGAEGEATRRIIDAAIPIFLADGFEAASIDAIVVAAEASKKTFYSKFSSKSDLFEAVLLRLIERIVPSIERAADLHGSTAERLFQVALAMLEAGLLPEAIAARRIVIAEATRFPQFALLMHDFGSSRGMPMIERCLEEGVRSGELVIDDIHFAAVYFVNVAVAPPIMGVLFGLERAEVTYSKRERLKNIVEVFIRSYRR